MARIHAKNSSYRVIIYPFKHEEDNLVPNYNLLHYWLVFMVVEVFYTLPGKKVTMNLSTKSSIDNGDQRI